jgi:UDP-N-acetyl-D-mannosaminuronic acid dehydrogenase
VRSPAKSNARISAFENDVLVMGGCGHAGLPLGMAFAARGLNVVLFDSNASVVDQVNSGNMPFREDGADELLPTLLEAKRLRATSDEESMATAEHVIVVVGTPVDRYLSPDISAVPNALEPVAHHLVDNQLIVLRSTVYPGVTALVERQIRSVNRTIDVCFCPERIAEGHALTELSSLPQIVAARTAPAMERAASLFRQLTDDIVELTPEEAELAKLFTNTWRYIKFAMANQLFMIANESGLDFERIRHAVTYKYPRAADMPGPGFAAGPCLFKDTMQIAAFSENNFTLGHASVMINEGLPLYTIGKLEHRYPLSTMTVGILGMAFKGGSDDTRQSLSYKLKRLLKLKAKSVLCTDPYVTTDPELVPLEEVLVRSDLLIVATPHPDYRQLRTPLPTVDLFNLFGQGVRV